MNIWVGGNKYSIDTIPNKVLALYLRKYIKVDWENTWLPETNKKESYAILNEAARRLVNELPMADKNVTERETGEEREYGVMYDDGMVNRIKEVKHDFMREISEMNGYQLSLDAKEFVEKLNYILHG